MKVLARFLMVVFLVVFSSEVFLCAAGDSPSREGKTFLIPAKDSASGLQVLFEAEQEFEENEGHEDDRSLCKFDVDETILLRNYDRVHQSALQFRLRLIQLVPHRAIFKLQRCFLI